jgi:hypothetical protein
VRSRITLGGHAIFSEFGRIAEPRLEVRLAQQRGAVTL